MKNINFLNIGLALVITLITTACTLSSITTDWPQIGQQDPLDAPIGDCSHSNGYVLFKSSSDFSTQERMLSRVYYDDTYIQAQVPSSQQWVTKCPVTIDPEIHGTSPRLSTICPQQDIFNGGKLKIVKKGSGLAFKVETHLGTFRGELVEELNPHGVNEVVWLLSKNVTLNGSSSPVNYDFYIFLQKNIWDRKYYLVEIFDKTTPQCIAAHRPNYFNLCINDDHQNHCQLPPFPYSNNLGQNDQNNIRARQSESTAHFNTRSNTTTRFDLSETSSSDLEPINETDEIIDIPPSESISIDDPIDWDDWDPDDWSQTASGAGHEPIEK